MHATDRQTRHTCGGTILTGGTGDTAHKYCDRCRAYSYDMSRDVPSGADEAANRRAWDNGDDASPDAPAADHLGTSTPLQILTRRA